VRQQVADLPGAHGANQAAAAQRHRAAPPVRRSIVQSPCPDRCH
jgi:hypothetical protein